MQIPRRFNTYCPHCNEHHEHEIEQVRRGQSSGMKKVGDRQRARAISGIGNSGKFSQVPSGEKPTRKTNLTYRCTECGRAHLRKGWRAGRVEFQD